MARSVKPTKTTIIDDIPPVQPEALTNPALKDIEEIVTTRPNLTPDELEIVDKASDWMKAQLKPTVRAELELDYAEKFTKQMADIRVENEQAIKNMMDDWKKSQEPLSKDDLQTLLSQEYITFDVPVKFRKKGKFEKRSFTLVELPQEVENRFIRLAQKNLIPLFEKANAREWRFGGNYSQMLQDILDELPSAFAMAAELVAICLNPWDEDDEITAEWVAKNLSSHRITKIIAAQFEVNKYRDFYSSDFQLFRTLKPR